MRAEIASPVGTDARCLIITLEGDIDMDCLASLAAVVEAFSRSARPSIRLNVSGVGFAGSDAVRTFVSLQSIAHRRGGTVTVAGASRSMRRVLAVTGEEGRFIILPGRPQLTVV